MNLDTSRGNRYLTSVKQNGNFFADTVNLNYYVRKGNRYNESIEKKLQETLWDKIEDENSVIGAKMMQATNRMTEKYCQLIESYLAYQKQNNIPFILTHSANALKQINLSHQEILDLITLNKTEPLENYLKDKVKNNITKNDKYEKLLLNAKRDGLSNDHLIDTLNNAKIEHSTTAGVSNEDATREIHARTEKPSNNGGNILFGSNNSIDFYKTIKDFDTHNKNRSATFRQKQFFLWRLNRFANDIMKISQENPEEYKKINDYLKEKYDWSLNSSLAKEVYEHNSSSPAEPIFRQTKATDLNGNFRENKSDTSKREGYDAKNINSSRLQNLTDSEFNYYTKNKQDNKIEILEGRDAINVDRKKQEEEKNNIYCKIVSENPNIPQTAGISTTTGRFIILAALVNELNSTDYEKMDTLVHCCATFMTPNDHSLSEILVAASAFGLNYRLDQNINCSLNSEIQESLNIKLLDIGEKAVSRFNFKAVVESIMKNSEAKVKAEVKEGVSEFINKFPSNVTFSAMIEGGVASNLTVNEIIAKKPEAEKGGNFDFSPLR